MWKIIKFSMELSLCKCAKNIDYVIKRIECDYKTKHRLKCLGFLEKEKVKLLNYNYGNTCCLVKVMGINYAIDKQICERIVVCV